MNNAFAKKIQIVKFITCTMIIVLCLNGVEVCSADESRSNKFDSKVVCNCVSDNYNWFDNYIGRACILLLMHSDLIVNSDFESVELSLLYVTGESLIIDTPDRYIACCTNDTKTLLVSYVKNDKTIEWELMTPPLSAEIVKQIFKDYGVDYYSVSNDDIKLATGVIKLALGY